MREAQRFGSRHLHFAWSVRKLCNFSGSCTLILRMILSENSATFRDHAPANGAALLLDNALSALTIVLDPARFAIILFGIVLGLVIGMMPGIGGLAGIA